MAIGDYNKGYITGLDKAIAKARRRADEEHARAEELHSRQLYMDEQEHRSRESTLRALIVELNDERMQRERLT